MDPELQNHGVATEDEQDPAASSAAEPSPEAAAPAGGVAAEVERITREKNDLQEVFQRRQAEFDNFRRRNERERGELVEYASMDTVKALVPILDDFERALKVGGADQEYARGMEMIYQRLGESLRKLGLEPISSEVAIFNPHIHHAVEMVETQDHPDQTILDEYQRGYYFKGRLLRPAMVKVAVNQ